jgi:hypothetical protein
MLRLAYLTSLLMGGVAPAAAQEEPDAVAERYAAALYDGDWAAVGRLLHPASVEAYVAGFTETDDPAILGALPLLDSLGSVDAARAWLREAGPAEAFARLAAADGGGAADYFGGRLAATEGYEAVGAVEDGSLVLVVLRAPPVAGPPLGPLVEVVAVGRVEGAWRVWPSDRGGAVVGCPRRW